MKVNETNSIRMIKLRSPVADTQQPEIQEAVNDPDVTAIGLSIDCPGGQIEPDQLQMEKPEVTRREDGTFDVRYRFTYRPFGFTKEGK